MPKRKIIQAASTEHLKSLVKEELRLYGPHCDLNHIDVSAITEFRSIFKNTDFNGNVSKWDTSKGLTFKSMFEGCPFNGDLSQWDTSQAFNMAHMFSGSKFNGDVSQWDVSDVTCMESMFENSAFNGDVSKWNVQSVRETCDMFKNSSFSGDVSRWDTIQLRQARSMFEGSPFNGDVSQWHVVELHNPRFMFFTPTFQRDLSAWQLPKGSMVDNLVHHDYSGVLPKATQADVHESYAEMLGRTEHLTQYAARTPFSRVHADLLVGDDEDCAWASQEVVRWAREQVKVGRALGFDVEGIKELMVAAKRNETGVHIEVGNLFEVTP